ncbi:hypothetical protein L209DRAFT_748065 [Thermothelomyces heterothallicus CBS 203.75]
MAQPMMMMTISEGHHLTGIVQDCADDTGVSDAVRVAQRFADINEEDQDSELKEKCQRPAEKVNRVAGLANRLRGIV